MYKIFGFSVDKKILLISLIWSGISFFMWVAYAGLYGLTNSQPSSITQIIQFLLFLPVSLANLIFSPFSQISKHIPMLNSIWLTNTLALADLLAGLVYGVLIISVGYLVTKVISKLLAGILRK
jgi:uncharacterized protein with PQ loop repeat